MSKKIAFFTGLMLLFAFNILNIQFVGAKTSPFDMIIEPEKSILLGSHVTFNMEVRNNKEATDAFIVDVKGDRMEWYVPGIVYTNIDPKASETIGIGFLSGGEDGGVFRYTVTVSLESDPTIKKSLDFILEVTDIYGIRKMETKKEGENLNVIMDFKLPERREADRKAKMEFIIKSPEGEIISTTSRDVSLDESGWTNKLFIVPIPEKLSPGIYSLEVYAGRDRFKAYGSFEIEEIYDIIKTTTKVEGVLYEDNIITIQNNGNTVVTHEIAKEFSRGDWITAMVTDPYTCYTEGEDTKKCIYAVEMQPGETKEIVYRKEYWQDPAKFAIGLGIVGGAVAISLGRVKRPRIIKRVIKRRDGHSVILHIKNPFGHHIKNSVLRDWVSPLAMITKEFQPAEPIVRKSRAGTELIWRLGELKPREERMISYKIKPLVKGSLKMPAASIRYINKKGKKGRTKSRPVVAA